MMRTLTTLILPTGHLSLSFSLGVRQSLFRSLCLSNFSSSGARDLSVSRSLQLFLSLSLSLSQSFFALSLFLNPPLPPLSCNRSVSICFFILSTNLNLNLSLSVHLSLSQFLSLTHTSARTRAHTCTHARSLLNPPFSPSLHMYLACLFNEDSHT